MVAMSMSGGQSFLSTPSARRATANHVPGPRLRPDFYPRPPRGGRLDGGHVDVGRAIISIHALREEGDHHAGAELDSGQKYFYPRPPRGGRLRRTRAISAHHEFLSTPSARRATTTYTLFNYRLDISIHALREEGDGLGILYTPASGLFLSTPSARRATSPSASLCWKNRYFYPRPP